METTLLPLVAGARAAGTRVDHHDLAGNEAGLRPKALALFGQNVAVDVAREDAVEARPLKGQGEAVGPNEGNRRQARPRPLQHRRALIEGYERRGVELLGDEPGAAAQVQHTGGGERRHHVAQLGQLLGPPRAVAAFEEPRALPPVVELRCTPVVVGMHLVARRVHRRLHVTLGCEHEEASRSARGMKRDATALRAVPHDLLVVGGGIYGVAADRATPVNVDLLVIVEAQARAGARGERRARPAGARRRIPPVSRSSWRARSPWIGDEDGCGSHGGNGDEAT